jgi:hypothetical protein
VTFRLILCLGTRFAFEPKNGSGERSWPFKPALSTSANFRGFDANATQLLTLLVQLSKTRQLLVEFVLFNVHPDGIKNWMLKS